eukprot:gene4577-9095_t
MGHEYVGLRNTAAAVQSYRQAVDVLPSDYRAWYGLGQTTRCYTSIRSVSKGHKGHEGQIGSGPIGKKYVLFFTMLHFILAAALRPEDARMWCAVGGQVAVIRAYERAVDCEDSEGIATRKFARLYM